MAENDNFVSSSVKDDRKQLVDRDEHDGSQRMEVSPLQLETNACHRASKGGQEGLKAVIISSICFAVSVTVALILTIYFGPPQVAPHGGVASDSKECSEIGVQLLTKGGSAVDAAIATSLCVGLVNPRCSGVGGGGVMLVRMHKANSTDVIEFMDAAPKVIQSTPFAVGIPGLLRGLQYAHEKFGNYNQNITGMHFMLLYCWNNCELTTTSQQLSWRDIVMSVVEVRTNDQRLIELLTKVADKGVGEFYSGQTARKIMILSKSNRTSVSDFSNYEVKHSKPISTTFFDKTVETAGSVTNGPVLLMVLNIMEHVLINNTALWNSTDLYHYVVEALKLAYDVSSGLHIETEENNVTAEITSKEFAARLASKIDPNSTVLEKVQSNSTETTLVKSGSSHVSVIGPSDDMVSVTLTLGSSSGWNGEVTFPNLGFYLNDHIAVVPATYQITPGQHLPDSISPAIVYSTRTACGQRLTVGGSHGDFSAAAVAELLVNIVGLKMDLVGAVNASRVYVDATSRNSIVYCDDETQTAVRHMLESKGHAECQKLAAGSNSINVLSKTNEIVSGYADMRSSNGFASVY